MTIIYLSAKNIQGVATDTKPTNVPDGSIFYETDTGNFWYMIAGTWTEKPVRNVNSDYDVYLHSTTIKARNNRTGLVKYTGTDVGAITNTIIADFTATGCKINYSNDLFIINTPITIPTTNAGLSRPWHFSGYKPSNIRGFATQFKIGSTFPDSRYVFECVAADTTLENASIKINGFFLNNQDFAPDGNGTTNIASSGDTTTRINAGFLKYESDYTTQIAGASPCHIEDVTWHYFWRGIHILGYVYWPVVWNCGGSGWNKHFVGDFDLKLERGSDGAQHGSAIELKGLDLRNFGTTHSDGNLPDGRGSMNQAMVFFGGYHNISHVFINGKKYNDAVIAWKQCFSSVFDDIGVLDLHPPQGDNFEAVFLFDTEDPAGNPAFSSYSTFNNQIKNIKGRHADGDIKFINGPFRNRLTDVYAYWGNNIIIDDAGAGIENIIEIIAGHQLTGVTNSKIISTNSIVKIIDKRVGASNRGIKQLSGTGSQTVFDIPHGCFGTPVDYDARPITADAEGARDLSVDDTNITVTYKIPPPGGTTNNLKWKWVAEVYA